VGFQLQGECQPKKLALTLQSARNPRSVDGMVILVVCAAIVAVALAAAAIAWAAVMLALIGRLPPNRFHS